MKSIFIHGRFEVILNPEANMHRTSAIKMVCFIELSSYSKFKVTELTNNPNKMIDLVVYFIVQRKQNNNGDEIYHVPVYMQEHIFLKCRFEH